MRETWRTVGAVLSASFAADRRLTVLAGLLAIAGWIVIPLQALAIKLFIDALVARDAGRGAAAVVAAGVTMGGLWYFNNIRHFVRITLQERTTHLLDRRLQRLIGELPGIDHLERPDYLDRIATLRAQSMWFANVAAIFEFPALTLNVALTGALLAAVDPALLLVPASVLPAIWFSRRAEAVLQGAEGRAAALRRLRLRLFEMAADPAVAGEARLFDARNVLLRRHAAADRQVNHILRWAGIADIVLVFAGWAVFVVGFALVLVVVVGGIRAGRLGIGDFFLAFFLVRGLTWQAQFFLYSIGNLQRTVTATRNYLWLERYAAEAEVRRGSAGSSPATGALDFDHVSFHYPGTTRDVLRDVTLHVPPGAVLALVGDNGAGKTTLVKLLARFYAPSAGRILAGGRDIAELDIDEWREGLTACFQDFCRFELVARETVGAGDLANIDDLRRVTAAIDAGAADAVVESLADGLETRLGASWLDGAELSVGQWQKLAVARALMRESPRLLLLDEPTAALDAESESRLLSRYAAASSFARASGAITVIVSHRMSTVRMADFIAVVEDGRIVESGSHEELVANGGLYGDMYAAQASAYR